MVQSTFPPTSNRGTSDSLTERELQLIGQAVLEHLRHESAYLDSVIDCSLKMTDLLKQSSYAERNPDSTSSSRSLVYEASLGQLNELRMDLVNQFEPLAVGRREMHSALKKLAGVEYSSEPSLRQLASQLDFPVRDELNQLRTQIRAKLQQVQAISLGNQAVLIYTLDFYHQLMTGISGESSSPPAYNANGQMTHSVTHHLVEKKC